MKKCNPVRMRENMKIATMMMEYGIDFVAVPVKSSQHKNVLVFETLSFLSELIMKIEES